MAWATLKTGVRYEPNKFEKRNLKLEKDFNFKQGNSDVVFNYILQSNELIRLKRENNLYQIIAMKDLKDFQLPLTKAEEVPGNLDFFSTEFILTDKESVKNALIIIKKLLSKNGKMFEVADGPKIQIIDTGIHLNAIRLIIGELNK